MFYFQFYLIKDYLKLELCFILSFHHDKFTVFFNIYVLYNNLYVYQFYYDFIINDKSCCNVMMQYICNGLNIQYMADCIESFQWENWVIRAMVMKEMLSTVKFTLNLWNMSSSNKL